MVGEEAEYAAKRPLSVLPQFDHFVGARRERLAGVSQRVPKTICDLSVLDVPDSPQHMRRSVSECVSPPVQGIPGRALSPDQDGIAVS